MNKPMVIFGLRDLPRPKGEGFLYCKLAPNYREKILVEYNLYAEPEQLQEIYTKGVERLLSMEGFDKAKRAQLPASYDTENMRPHARDILDRVLRELC